MIINSLYSNKAINLHIREVQLRQNKKKKRITLIRNLFKWREKKKVREEEQRGSRFMPISSRKMTLCTTANSITTPHHESYPIGRSSTGHSSFKHFFWSEATNNIVVGAAVHTASYSLKINDVHDVTGPTIHICVPIFCTRYSFTTIQYVYFNL